MKLNKSPLLAFLLILSSLSLHAQTDCFGLMWSDEFEGTSLDESKWSYDIGDGCPNLCGWGNNELEYYTNSTNNVRVEDGNLIIEAIKNGDDITSGKIVTRGKASWTYGRFEARMKLPRGRGTWPAFWLLPTVSNWPMTGEIDIMENRGDHRHEIGGALHYGPPWPNNQNDATPYVNLAMDFTEEFHVFAVEWDENSISWFVDDNLYKVETRDPNSLNPPSGNDPWPFDTDFYIILNVAVGGWYPGVVDRNLVNIEKGTMEVDYVRVYGNDAPLGDQEPFAAGPMSIPGKLEVEDYDIACPGVAYFDVDGSNRGGAYRDQGVDIEETSDVGGGHNIGWTSDGEWMEYTLDVTSGGLYDVQVRSASESEGGSLSLELDGQPLSNDISLPATGGWQTWDYTLVEGIDLPQGEHILRVNIENAGFNLNYLNFVAKDLVGVDEHFDSGIFDVYPNPGTDKVYFANLPTSVDSWRLMNLLGEEVSGMKTEANSIDMTAVPVGTYYVEVTLVDGERRLARFQKAE